MSIPETFEIEVSKVEAASGLIFTRHAVERMWERRIRPDCVKGVIESPEVSTTENRREKRYTKCWGGTAEGRVYVCLADDNPDVVISVGWRDKE